jgi:hypothetical protein
MSENKGQESTEKNAAEFQKILEIDMSVIGREANDCD